MKKIRAHCERVGVGTYEASITDRDAFLAIMTRRCCGFSPDDALHALNSKLKKCGYEAEYVGTGWDEIA